MKCIQSIKATKEVELGTIIRTDDKDAHSKVKDGYWKYIPKTEWKKIKPKQEPSQKVQEDKGEKTKSKKAQNRSKLKEKQRQ